MTVHTKPKTRLDFLLVVAAFAAFTIWYVLDAASASTRVENLALILPAGVLSLTLLAGIAVKEIIVGDAAQERATVRERSPWLMVAAVGAFVSGIEPLGFLPSTVAFLAVSLVILGERRPLVIALYALGLGIAMSLVFERIADVPAPFWSR